MAVNHNNIFSSKLCFVFFTSGHYFPPASLVPSQFCQRLQDLGTSDVTAGVTSLCGEAGELVKHKLHLPHAQYGQHVHLVSQHLSKVRGGGREIAFRHENGMTEH